MGDKENELGPSPDFASHWYWLKAIQAIPPAVARAIASHKKSETIGDMELRVMASAPPLCDLEKLKAPNGSRLLKYPSKLHEEKEGRFLIVASVAVCHLEQLKKKEGFKQLTFPESLYEATPTSRSPFSSEPGTEPRPTSRLSKHPDDFEEGAEKSKTAGEERGSCFGADSDMRKSSKESSAPVQNASQQMEDAMQPGILRQSNLVGANELPTTSVSNAKHKTPLIDDPLWGSFSSATSSAPVAVGVIDMGWCPCILRRVGNLERVVFFEKHPRGINHPDGRPGRPVPDLSSPWVEYTRAALLAMKGSNPCVCSENDAPSHGLQMLRIVAANAPDNAKIYYWNCEGAGTRDQEAAADMSILYSALKCITDYSKESDQSCVISCSLERSLGSHDQWEPLQARFDELAGDTGTKGITFVVAAGNLRRRGYHARIEIKEPVDRELPSVHSRTIGFRFGSSEKRDKVDSSKVTDLDPLEVEFWFNRPPHFMLQSLDLKELSRELFNEVVRFEGAVALKRGKDLLAVVRDVSESVGAPAGSPAFNARCGLQFTLHKTNLPTGAGSILLFELTINYASSAAGPLIVDAWANPWCSVYRAPSGAVEDEGPERLTLSGLTGSLSTVVVAAAKSDAAEAQTSDVSGFGPTRTGHEQPCVQACGVFRVRDGDQDFVKGTSHATAAVAGLIAQRVGRGVDGGIRDGFIEAFSEQDRQSEHHHGRGFGFVNEKVARGFVGDRGSQV